MKTIVVSAVNIRRGGTLRILRDCLSYLSGLAAAGEYRVVAIVHDKALVPYSGIEFIEIPGTVGSWRRRLWCEYVTMHRLSARLAPVYLWFSLHDTTPRVKAERQAAYFQTSFPFMKLKGGDWRFDYKIGLFGLFTRFAYRINIRRNSFIVVQAEWLRRGFSKMFGLAPSTFIVAPPEETPADFSVGTSDDSLCRFAYVCGPDCHKNIELVCEAARRLEDALGPRRFRLNLTVSGSENRYARWLKERWGDVESINFLGYLSREDVNRCYSEADCLVFPSRIETWGLPISEFRQSRKPMLLADLPYAHEAAAGSEKVAFFKVDDPDTLMQQMMRIVNGDRAFLSPVGHPVHEAPYAGTWRQVFDYLLN